MGRRKARYPSRNSRRARRSTLIREYKLSTIPAGYCGPYDHPGCVHILEKLVDSQTTENGVRMFLVKWMGYPDFKNTWELEETLPASLVSEFDDKNNNFNCSCTDSGIGLFDNENNLSLDSPPCSEIQESDRSYYEAENEAFPDGWIAEEVTGVLSGTKMLVVKFQGEDQLLYASLEYCRIKIPQLVIQFFQNH